MIASFEEVRDAYLKTRLKPCSGHIIPMSGHCCAVGVLAELIIRSSGNPLVLDRTTLVCNAKSCHPDSMNAFAYGFDCGFLGLLRLSGSNGQLSVGYEIGFKIRTLSDQGVFKVNPVADKAADDYSI